MVILGIETSCDETAAAVIKDGTKILSNTVASSADMHVKTGGVIPEQAARQQVKSIIPVISQVLVGAFCKQNSPIAYHQSLGAGGHGLETVITNVDAIAVTVGPGLIGSLLVGVETAKTLAYLWNKPIIPVNHLVAHIYASWLETEKIPQKVRVSQNAKSVRDDKTGLKSLPALSKTNHQSPITNRKSPKFPALCLVVSGGHTDLVLMKNHGKLIWIGGTRDDAAGEAFDKTARLLGLPYPGGPAISSAAENYFNQSLITNHKSLTLFPRPMIDENNFDWSFSGLKTAVLRKVKEQDLPAGKAGSERVKEELDIQRLAAEIQEAIVDVLVIKTLKAAKKYKPKSLLLAGGVAANKRLREKFQSTINNQQLPITFYVPPSSLCTDNAAYVASYAFFNYHPIPWEKVQANPQLTIVGEA